MSINSVVQHLRKHNSFLLSTHVNADPDALCSELALYYCLKSKGKKVVIVNNEKAPSRLSFLPGTKMIKGYSSKLKIKFDAAIIVDCGSLERIGRVVNLIPEGCPVINIDHHVTNDKFGHVNLVKPAASSTAEILFDVLKAARCRMNKTIALHLYAGIMTDTGSFRYENTSAKTHRIVAELKEYPFSSTKLFQKLYETIPPNDVRLFARLVSKHELHYKGKVASVLLPRKMISQFSKDFDLRDTIFKLLRSMNGVEVAVIITQVNAKQSRVNFRSAGRINVALLARYFNGGGHHNASGCMIDQSILQAKRSVLKKLKETL